VRKLKNTPSEGKGHTFESCRVRQFIQLRDNLFCQLPGIDPPAKNKVFKR
jgi:hypothetical protein